MNKIIVELECEIAKRRTEIKALEEAVRTIRSVVGNEARSLPHHEEIHVRDVSHVPRGDLLPFQDAGNTTITTHGRIPNRADVMADIMWKKGRPLTVREIYEGLKELNHSLPTDMRSAVNSIYGSLKNAADRFENADRGLWRLRPTAKQ